MFDLDKWNEFEKLHGKFVPMAKYLLSMDIESKKNIRRFILHMLEGQLDRDTHYKLDFQLNAIASNVNVSEVINAVTSVEALCGNKVATWFNKHSSKRKFWNEEAPLNFLRTVIWTHMENIPFPFMHMLFMKSFKSACKAYTLVHPDFRVPKLVQKCALGYNPVDIICNLASQIPSDMMYYFLWYFTDNNPYIPDIIAWRLRVQIIYICGPTYYSNLLNAEYDIYLDFVYSRDTHAVMFELLKQTSPVGFFRLVDGELDCTCSIYSAQVYYNRYMAYLLDSNVSIKYAINLLGNATQSDLHKLKNIDDAFFSMLICHGAIVVEVMEGLIECDSLNTALGLGTSKIDDLVTFSTIISKLLIIYQECGTPSKFADILYKASIGLHMPSRDDLMAAMRSKSEARNKVKAACECIINATSNGNMQALYRFICIMKMEER